MLTPGKSLVDKLGSALTRLQSSANAVIDSDLDRLSDDVNPGIKQVNMVTLPFTANLNWIMNLDRCHWVKTLKKEKGIVSQLIFDYIAHCIADKVTLLLRLSVSSKRTWFNGSNTW